MIKKCSQLRHFGLTFSKCVWCFRNNICISKQQRLSLKLFIELMMLGSLKVNFNWID